MGDILSDAEDVKISSNLILASWNCWERDIILNFIFRFSYSGYDFILIIKSQILNCSLFLFKLLLETKS